MPALVTVAIAWLSRPRGSAALTGLPVAVIDTSPSPGGAAGAVSGAVRVLRRVGAQVLDDTVTVPHAHEALLNPDADLQQRLGSVLAELAASATRSSAA